MIEPKAPLAHCESCPLQDRPFVPGHGPEKADIVICGEAPGATEVDQQRPFVGKSGQLLTRILQQSGVKRDDVYITNACLCRPPANATPSAKAIKACRDRLVSEISSRSPSVVVAMGGPSAKAVLNSRDGISKLRVGGVKSVDDLPGVNVIPTFHPAFALRKPDALPSILDDLKPLNAGHIEIGWEPTRYEVATEVEDGLNMLRAQLSSRELALDIENDPHPSGPYSREDGCYPPEDPQWLCIGIADRPGHAVVYDKPVVESPRFKNFLAAVLANHDRAWVYQNGKYDIQHLWSFAPEARVDEDSMLAHFAVDERKGTHDLEQLATKYLGAPDYKTETREHIGEDDPLGKLPKDLLWKYNATDVDCTLRLMEPLRKEMASDGVEQVYRRLLIPATDVLARVERRGLRVDAPLLNRLEAESTQEEEAIEHEITERWGINPRSWKQLLEKFAEQGYELNSTRAEILEEVSKLSGVSTSTAVELADAILHYRAVHIRLRTFIRGNRKRISTYDQRIHPGFLLHGTETGRLSSRRPNIQNQPRTNSIRDIFIADEGYSLIQSDYSQGELRLGAWFSQDPWLLQAFREERSIYEEVARSFYGESYKGKKHDSERYVNVKTIVLASLYHESPGHLARRQHIPFKQAKGIVDTFNQSASGVRRWQNTLAKEILTKQHLTSYYGRKRRFWLITDDNRHEVLKEGYNFPLQSTLSDLTLDSLIKLEPMLRGKAEPLITVHDSLVWQCAPDLLDEVGTIVRETMEDTPFDMPFPVELAAGPSWGSLKPI